MSRAELAGSGGPQARATVTVEEAAEVLGISRGLAYELVRRGELPSLRLGHRVVIPLRVVDELLGSVRVESPAAPRVDSERE